MTKKGRLRESMRMMKVSETPKRIWRFVYHLWYPGVLGSMLYDLLQGPGDNYQVYFGRLLVAIVYSVDYVHLFHDLSETTQELGFQAPVLDFLIALGFGLSASFLDTIPSLSCLAIGALAILFMLYYSVRSAPYFWWVVRILGIVGAALLGVYWFTASPLSAFLYAMVVFASLYVVFCFWVYPKLVRSDG